MAHKNYIAHIRNKKHLIGAQVIRTDNGNIGTIIDVIDLHTYMVDFDNHHVIVSSSEVGAHVVLEDGKKYMCMDGTVVTIYKNKYGPDFHFKYGEIGGWEDATEHIDANGLAYHCDCGCNILKPYVESDD